MPEVFGDGSRSTSRAVGSRWRRARVHWRQPPRGLRHQAPTVACHSRPHSAQRHQTLRAELVLNDTLPSSARQLSSVPAAIRPQSTRRENAVGQSLRLKRKGLARATASTGAGIHAHVVGREISAQERVAGRNRRCECWGHGIAAAGRATMLVGASD